MATTCTCQRQGDRFPKPTLVNDDKGNLFLLVGGQGLRFATIQIIEGERRRQGFSYHRTVVRAEIPLEFCEMLLWDALKARRSILEPDSAAAADSA